jgi:hypothetical protein
VSTITPWIGRNSKLFAFNGISLLHPKEHGFESFVLRRSWRSGRDEVQYWICVQLWATCHVAQRDRIAWSGMEWSEVVWSGLKWPEVVWPSVGTSGGLLWKTWKSCEHQTIQFFYENQWSVYMQSIKSVNANTTSYVSCSGVQFLVLRLC